jgi:diketogulonate reductase-like aldo/keto reductase
VFSGYDFWTLLGRSIGVSNFNVEQLQTIIKTAKIKPAVNQVRFSLSSNHLIHISTLVRSVSILTIMQNINHCSNIVRSMQLSLKHTAASRIFCSYKF